MSIQSDESNNSVLVITAIEESPVTPESPASYTSAKLTTKGLQEIRYGRIEARIKLPEGQGLWPAFWMLGENIDEIDWPGCGEIDILELLGHEPNTIHHNVHYTNSGNAHEELLGSHVLSSGSFSSDYHVFALDWTPQSLVYRIDGQMTHQVPIEEEMKEFMRSAYLILNVAVGGNWPGDPDDTTVFPQSMYVDYVRLYRQDNLQVSDPPPLDINEESLGQILDASPAIRDSFDDFGVVNINLFGGPSRGDGPVGQPEGIASDGAVNGDKSIQISYTGGNWGGAFFEMDMEKDFSTYAGGNLLFSIKAPATLHDAEVKLESTAAATNAAIFLVNYTPEDIGNGWVKYTVPISDFSGLDLTKLSIPFALWNPKDADDGAEDYLEADILIDDIHMEMP